MTKPTPTPTGTNTTTIEPPPGPNEPYVGQMVWYWWDGVLPFTGTPAYPPVSPSKSPSDPWPVPAVITSLLEIRSDLEYVSLFCMGTGDTWQVKECAHMPGKAGFWGYIGEG